MSVRLVIATLTLVVAVVAAVVGVAFTELVSRRAFVEVERTDALVDHDRVISAWEQGSRELERLAKDWAWWTDTHEFVQGRDSAAYRTSNLQPSTFDGLQVDVVVMLDATGAARFAGEVRDAGYDALDGAVLARLAADDLSRRTDPADAATGIVRASDGRLLLLSSWPVTTSDGAATPVGTLTFGRWVDDEVVGGLEEISKLDVLLEPVAPTTGVPAGPAAIDGFARQTVSTSSVLADIDGAAALSVQVTSPRRMASIAAQSLTLQRLGTVAGALLAGIVLLLAINRLVVRRIRDLQGQVTAIGTEQTSGGRVRLDGRDELAQLADDVNAMLDGLERLSRRAEHFEEADALKGRLLALVSHELRTPLTIINGFAETLRHRFEVLDPDTRQQALDKIGEQAADLDRRIGHLLAVADAERVGITADRTDVALSTCLADVLQAHPTTDVLVDVPDRLAVLVDPCHLSWILDELVTNAERYAPGRLRVDARRHADGTVTLAVTDHGHGVPDDFVPLLFRPFEQASMGDRRTAHGVGLGLAHARTLACANGGALTHERTEDGGARFVLSLQAGRTAPPEPDPPQNLTPDDTDDDTPEGITMIDERTHVLVGFGGATGTDQLRIAAAGAIRYFEPALIPLAATVWLFDLMLILR